MCNRVCAIIILYNPDNNILKKWVDVVLRDSTVTYIFVDNSITANDKFSELRAHYLPQYVNKGIAEAQNIGIEFAVKQLFDYLIFFDQDSLYDSQFVEILTSEYKRAKSLNSRIVMAGPLVIDADTMHTYKNIDDFHEGISKVDVLISSGTIIDRDSVFKVGCMDSGLFIDYVDFEWCWRAKHMGYECVKLLNVKLYHTIGQNRSTFLGFPLITSSPVRYYYQYRNLIMLSKRSYIPCKWKIKSGCRKLAELFILPFYVNNYKYIFKNILIGIMDGFLYFKK